MADRADAHRSDFHRDQPWKMPVRCATTAAITIATGLNAGDVIDGVTLAAGDRVLVKDQGTGSQNGIYDVAASPVRSFDFNTGMDAVGALVFVREGTQAGKFFVCTTTGPVTIGSTTLVFAAMGGGGAGARQVGVTFDGGAASPTAGAFADITIPVDGTIVSATMLGDRVGSAEIDVLVSDFPSAPPVTSIVAAAPPTLSAELTSQDPTLSGWTLGLTAGDVVRFHLTSASTLFRVTLVLEYA